MLQLHIRTCYGADAVITHCLNVTSFQTLEVFQCGGFYGTAGNAFVGLAGWPLAALAHSLPMGLHTGGACTRMYVDTERGKGADPDRLPLPPSWVI